MVKDVIECERCEYQWATDSDKQKVTCTSCGYKTDRNVVAEEVFLRGKFLYMESEDLDDMIEATRERLEVLQNLRDAGYEVSDPDALQDDYCTLRRPVEEE